jgi:uncharacterized membrane protein
MSFLGITSVAICTRIDERILLKAVFVLRRIPILHVLYKRLEKATESAWLFFLAEVVSAQVPRQRNPNVELYRILPRSATP